MRKLVPVLLILLSVCTSAPAAEMTTPTLLSPDTVSGIGSTISPTAITPAEKVKNDENVFQQRLAAISREVDELSASVTQMRTQTSPPDRQDVDRLEQKIGLAEQELARTMMGQTSPIAKLQESGLQDQLFALRLSLETLKRRFGWAETSVFGLDFFANASPTDEPDARIVPQSYQLRPGDSVQLIVTSRLGGEKQYLREVGEDGKLFVPALGTISASGKTVRELESAVNSKYRKDFPQLTAAVSVSEVSSIAVKIAGSVKRPGTYKLTGASTVLDALYKAGGPTAAGSFRRISLTRDREGARTIDLYGFLMDGSKSQDSPLRDGDMIFVPPVGKTIVVDGQVIRPGRYEPVFPLSLKDAIAMAGDTKSSGYLQTVSIDRVENGEYKTLVNAKLQDLDATKTIMVQPGDQISVLTIQAEKTNRVSISGPVNTPGDYAFRDGMRVSELVKTAQGIITGAEIYPRRADILRIESGKGATVVPFDLEKALSGEPGQDIALQKLDRVFIYEWGQVEYRANYFTVTGAVSRPGTYRRTNSATVADAIAAAGGVLPNAYLARADLIRHGKGDGRELVRLDLGSALSGNAAANLVLTDRDQITVYTHSQVQTNYSTVSVSGAVQRPGSYDRADNMRVSDLVFLAGGLIPEAGDFIEISHAQRDGGVEISRVSVSNLIPGSSQDLILRDGDVVSVPAMSSALRTPMTVTVSGEVAHPGTYAIDPRTTRLADVIERAGGLIPTADSRNLIFLRKKEAIQEASQQGSLDLITRRMASYVSKQFIMQMAQITSSGAQPQQRQPFEQAANDLQEISDVSIREIQPGVGASRTQSGAQNSERFVMSGDGTGKASAMGSKIENATLPRTNSPVLPDMVAPENYGRIGVDLVKAVGDPESKHNLLLRDGDRITVPTIPDTVTVVGAVLHPHSFVAEDGKKVSYFVDKSGGYAPDASRKYMIIVRANGDALPADRVRTVEAGDIIYVPSTGLIDMATKTEKIGSITKILSDILSSAFIITRF